MSQSLPPDSGAGPLEGSPFAEQQPEHMGQHPGVLLLLPLTDSHNSQLTTVLSDVLPAPPSSSRGLAQPQQQQQQQPVPPQQQQQQQQQFQEPLLQPQPQQLFWLHLLLQLMYYVVELGLKPAGVWPADHPEPCPLCQLPRSEQMAVLALLGCKLPGWREQLLQQQGNVGMWQRAVQLMDRYSALPIVKLPQEVQRVVSDIRGHFLPALEWFKRRRQYAFWQDKLCQLYFYIYELGQSDECPVAPMPPSIRHLLGPDRTAVLELLNIERMPSALQLRQLLPLPQWELVLEEQQGMWVAALQLVRAYSTAAAVQDAPNLEDLPMRELDALREIINWQE